ncbi:MAG: glycosyltransferase family 39 protein, partial [Anaerolinea sp.]|nr:glycosyltransferase family 39 protein [Anaerolinea sp.]
DDADSTSRAFLVVAVGMGALALVSLGVGALGLRGIPRLDDVRRRLARWRTPYLTGAILIGISFGLLMRPEWVYAHAGITLALLLTLIYGAVYSDTPPISRTAQIAIGIGVLAITLVRIYSLSYYPNHNVADEGWVLGWALSWVRDGYFHDLVMAYGGSDIQRFMLPVALWISAFGAGFWQTRLFFYLAALLVIALSGLAARNLYRSAWIAVLALFSSALVMSAATIRHDVGLALGVAASLWLWSEAIKRKTAWLHLLAGMMVGLGMFAHYHASFFGLALLIGLYVPPMIAARRFDRNVILFGVGGALGAALVVIFQIIPDWQGFLAVRQTRSPLSLSLYGEALLIHIGNNAFHSQYDGLLIAGAVIGAVVRAPTETNSLRIGLLIIVVIVHLALPYFAAYPAAPQYLVPLTPVYALLFAGVFAGERAPRWAAAAIFFSVSLGYSFAPPVTYLLGGGALQPQPPPAIAWIRENVRPDETIVAEHQYFLYLTDYRYISPESPGYMHPEYRAEFQAVAPTIDVSAFAAQIDLPVEAVQLRTAVWDAIAPDVVVIDSSLSTCCNPPIMLPAYLEARGYQLVAEISGGRVPVYVYRKGGA